MRLSEKLDDVDPSRRRSFGNVASSGRETVQSSSIGPTQGLQILKFSARQRAVTALFGMRSQGNGSRYKPDCGLNLHPVSMLGDPNAALPENRKTPTSLFLPPAWHGLSAARCLFRGSARTRLGKS